METGTHKGGSALFYAAVLEHVNKKGRLITADIEHKIGEASKHKLFKRRIEFILGSSVFQPVIEKMSQRIKGAQRVLVVLDSLHTKDHVLKELNLHSSFVSKGSYVVVQDTFSKGVSRAVQEFLKAHPEFQVDRSREKFIFSKHSGGFLKRVR